MRKNHYLFLIASTFLCSCNSQTKSISDHIVIVNAGVSSRVRLAKDIAYINSLHPKVIAIDFQFSEQKGAYGDSMLVASLDQCENLIMAVEIKGYPHEIKSYTELGGTLPQFLTKSKVGFVNLLAEEDEFQTLKKFSTYEKVNGKIIYPLGVQAAMAFDSSKTMSFLKGKPKIINVDYKGDEKVFHTVSYQNLINRKVSENEIKDKIILIGFIGLYDGYKGAFDEDKFFSPLNNKQKPYKPDMYGVVYHANVIATVLGGR